MTIDERMEALTAKLETNLSHWTTVERQLRELAASAIEHDRQIAALTAKTASIDRQIEALIAATMENTHNLKILERQWQAYLNTLPKQ